MLAGTMSVNIDQLRINMLRNMWKVIECMTPLVDSYKKGGHTQTIDRYETEELFDSINDLRAEIGLLMYVFDDTVNMSDLSHLLENVPYIKYDEVDND